jgi:ketosteroid isomerase-like protein
MSQENVEIVRQGFEAFERGELDVMLDLFTDDVITYRVDPDGARYDGKLDGGFQRVAGASPGVHRSG